MKIFKIYAQIDEYVVLQCPNCGKQFRTAPQNKVFGKDRKNAKCQQCEKLFDFNSNQLVEDPLIKHWDYFDDRQMIMIKPNGDQIFFKRDRAKTPIIKSANETD